MKALKTVFAAVALIAVIFMASAGFALQEPVLGGIPDQKVNRNSGALEKIIDLREFASDERSSPNELFYSINSQSNIRLIDCFIEDDYFVSCAAPHEDALGMSTIKARAINSLGLSDTDEFNINVIETFEAETVVFEADRKKATIEAGDSINVQLAIENTFNETLCFTLDAELDNEERDEISATPGNSAFCLNSGEKTGVTLTITSFDDARTGLYDIKLVLNYGKGAGELLIDAEIVDFEEPIDIVRTGGYFVCKEPYTQEIGVRLENNSARTQTIELSAQHELLLPVFEFPTTTLFPGEEDEMALRIHTNGTTALREYVIPVFARSENFFVERDITIRLIECETDEFSLEVSPDVQGIQRGSREFYTVKLTSNSDKGVDIRLGSDGTLPNSLEKHSVFLPARSERTVELIVEARESDDDGAHKIKVTAWSSNETEAETVKAVVESEHRVEVLVENNNFEARVCSASNGQVYTITVKNTGDFTENVELRLRNVPETVQAVLSEDEIEVRKGKEETVFVFINPGFDTAPADYTATFIADWGEDFKAESLRFRVVEANATARENILEIVSYPREVEIAPGEEKQLEFAIRNPLVVPMENIRLRVYGLLNDEVTMFPVSVAGLGGGNTITLTRTIRAAENAGPDVYNATLEVRADGYVTTRPLRVEVVSQSPEAVDNHQNGFLAGFFAFSGSDFLIGGVIILILLIAIIIVLSLLHSNKSGDLAYYDRSNRGA